MSAVHWIIVVLAISWVVPLWRILKRTGKSPAIALVGIIPLFGMFLMWYIAYSEWTVERETV